MSRDLKFRAWDPYAGKRGIMLVNHTFKSISQTRLKDAEDVIWMQYTGLKVKEEVEVWEGDILRIHDPECNDGFGENYHYRLVEFKSGGFLLDWDFGEYDTTYLGWALEWFSDRGYIVEVIGNIYEHPQLINN